MERSDLDEKSILKAQADAILNTGVKITFVATDKDGKQKEVAYTLRRLKLGTLLRMSKVITNIDQDLMGVGGGIYEEFLIMLKYNINDAIYAIACALTNDRDEPSEEVIDQVKWGLDSRQMAEIFGLIVEMMDVSNFTSGIISLIGTSVLQKMNP